MPHYILCIDVVSSSTLERERFRSTLMTIRTAINGGIDESNVEFARRHRDVCTGDGWMIVFDSSDISSSEAIRIAASIGGAYKKARKGKGYAAVRIGLALGTVWRRDQEAPEKGDILGGPGVVTAERLQGFGRPDSIVIDGTIACDLNDPEIKSCLSPIRSGVRDKNGKRYDVATYYEPGKCGLPPMHSLKPIFGFRRFILGEQRFRALVVLLAFFSLTLAGYAARREMIDSRIQRTQNFLIEEWESAWGASTPVPSDPWHEIGDIRKLRRGNYRDRLKGDGSVEKIEQIVMISSKENVLLKILVFHGIVPKKGGITLQVVAGRASGDDTMTAPKGWRRKADGTGRFDEIPPRATEKIEGTDAYVHTFHLGFIGESPVDALLVFGYRAHTDCSRLDNWVVEPSGLFYGNDLDNEIIFKKGGQYSLCLRMAGQHLRTILWGRFVGDNQINSSVVSTPLNPYGFYVEELREGDFKEIEACSFLSLVDELKSHVESSGGNDFDEILKIWRDIDDQEIPSRAFELPPSDDYLVIYNKIPE